VSAGEQTLLLFSGIVAVLVAASLIGFVLNFRYAESPVVGNLNARIKAWWVMVALIGLAFALGKAGVITLFAIASFAALREFLTLTRTRRGGIIRAGGRLFVVLPLQFSDRLVRPLFDPDSGSMFSRCCRSWRHCGALRPILCVRIAEVQWSLVISVYCVSSATAASKIGAK
jgi:phosphatidate cytidylyltransferase